MGKLRRYLEDYGLQGTVATIKDRIFHTGQQELSYEKWADRSRLSSRDYARMAKEVFAWQPVIGVLAHAEGTDRTALLQSLSLQIYRFFRSGKECRDLDYMLFAGPGCSLAPDLLYQCVKLLNESLDEIDLIYFDSDRIGPDGRKMNPAFRPEYDPQLLSRVNYIGNVFLVRTKTAVEAGLPSPDWKEDEYHKFLKRIALIEDAAPGHERDGRIRHIPRILYHEADAAGRGFAGQEGDRSADGSVSGGKGNDPLISVLIPNRDHADDLERCIRSLQEKNNYRNLEILILENGSTEEETFRFYEVLQKTDPRVRILTWDRGFNYSAINNFGAANADGDYLLFLNNDTAVIREDSLRILQRLASGSGVGAAGAMLLYGNGTVQHAGVILGHGGIAAHAFQGEDPAAWEGLYPSLLLQNLHNVSAVTGACLMMRRELFLKAGGFDEELAVTFNDVDLCLRLRRDGLRILEAPDARLFHYESVSRGAEDSPEKLARFHSEIRHFVKKWEKELAAGDPFYNPNLTLTGRTFSCRDQVREARAPYLKYLHLGD